MTTNTHSELEKWALDLAAKLKPLTEDYHRFCLIHEGKSPDDEFADAEPSEISALLTFIANQSLTQITLALHELPHVQDLIRTGPIPDLLAALDDLNRGLHPPLLQAHPSMSGRLSTKIDMLKLRATASVFMLKRSGVKDAPARRIVAKIFADAGHTGKKGKPISASTLFEWCAHCEPDAQGTDHQKILADRLAKVRTDLTQSELIALIKAEALTRL